MHSVRKKRSATAFARLRSISGMVTPSMTAAGAGNGPSSALRRRNGRVVVAKIGHGCCVPGGCIWTVYELGSR